MALIINPGANSPEESRKAAPQGLPASPLPSRSSLPTSAPSSALPLPTKAPRPMSALPTKPMTGGSGLPGAFPASPSPIPTPALPTPALPTPATRPAPALPTQPVAPTYVAPPVAAPVVAPMVQSVAQQAPAYVPQESSRAYVPPVVDGKNARRNAASSNNVKKKRSARSTMILMRWLVLGGVAFMVLIGVKSIVFPPSLPSSGAIVNQVQQGLGVTNFPADAGEGFVLGFADAYMTVSPDVSSSARDELLSKYTNTSILTANGVTYPSGYEQKIINGPYVFGLRYTSNNTAVYTVGAETDTQGWIYLSVNVFYDQTARAFAVPSAPSIAPPPALSTMPSQKIIAVDEEATSSAKNTVDAFFSAWGASNQDALSVVLSPNADARAVNGLMGKVEFQSVSSLEVAKSDDPSVTVRQGVASVVWLTGQDGVKYTSTYQVLLVRASDNKWYVQDVLPAQFTPSQP